MTRIQTAQAFIGECRVVRRKIVLIVVAIAALAGAATYALTRPEPADTRYSGAYVLDDGSLVFITPREGNVLRYRLMNGESAAIWPVGAEGEYEGGSGWAEREPVVDRIRFDMDSNEAAVGFTWERPGEPTRKARAANLPERFTTFRSGALNLRGKLVTPRGAGPFPVVVLVHGSGDESAVDYYFEPYLYAANGFASLVFDKRGTGESEGEYLQNFHVLSDDVVAAVHWLRSQQEIDGDNIHLAGFSQGGWIAPLAALKDRQIRSVLVGYGVMKPVTSEDRWGYVYALRQKGFGEPEIARADRINTVIEDVIDRHQNRWSELGEMVDAARDEPWFEAVKGSDSMLGEIADLKLPLSAMRLYVWWRLGAHRDPPFIDRQYDPAPTMGQLDAPSLWLLAGEDSSAPAEWTVEELDKLQAAGKPVEYVVYPQAEHGILRFTQGADGERSYLGYEPDYFPKQIEWLQRQSSNRGGDSGHALTKVTRNSATLGSDVRSSQSHDYNP
ncbi:MAG: alpha/beta hydrolase family protein [Steroidobacter sp.]